MYNEIYRQGGTFMESYKNITPQEARKLMKEEKVMVVDVREPDEYAEGHVPGAILIPLGTIGNGRPENLPDINVPILTYCRSGARSAKAVSRLAALGYKHVYDFGGILNWPYETEKQD